MNLFQRKAQRAVIPHKPALASALEVAERAVETANERLAAVSKEFRELQERYQVRVDRDGQIAYAIVPDVTFRAKLETKVRANLRARNEALEAFYRALNVWAGLKGGQQCQ